VFALNCARGGPKIRVETENLLTTLTEMSGLLLSGPQKLDQVLQGRA
jgi:hypothetical protein